MRRPAALFLFCVVAPVMAQTAIHRCLGGDGRPVYTDQPCASVGATSLTPSPAASAAATSGAPSATLLCAKDIGALREAIAQAFAQRSANRIGGLILWHGTGGTQAMDSLRMVDGLVRQRLVSLEGDESKGIEAVTTVPGGDGSTRRTHFDLVRESGCLWLGPPR